MFVVLKATCDETGLRRVMDAIEAAGGAPVALSGHARPVLEIRQPERVDGLALDGFPEVERVLSLDLPYRLASRELSPDPSVVEVAGVRFGGKPARPVVIAGPCAVESEAQIAEAARLVKGMGADLLRGGAFKPRTSPYAFRGLGERGLKILQEVAADVGIPVVTEAMDTRHLGQVASSADMIQIGSRNMQNFPLLEEAGRSGKPVLLKRGRACTVEEWLCAAEYILNTGNPQVVLCERGVVSIDGAVRNLLDLSAVPLVRELSHLPVVVDPSHGTGRSELVPALARAAVAAGADGVMVEVHPRPERARSDARQALRPDQFEALCADVRAIAGVLQGGTALLS